MPDTDHAPQDTFDPHYEWQGEHYEWQGGKVRGIQDSINPPPPGPCPAQDEWHVPTDPASRRLQAWGNGFSCLVCATPGLILCVTSLLDAVPQTASLLWLAFFGLLASCGLGGMTLIVLGCKEQSKRVTHQGVFGLFVFFAILMFLLSPF